MQNVVHHEVRHPPKARLVLRVGITGHRPNRLGRADEATLRDRVRDVLGRIERIVLAWHGKNTSLYSSAPPVFRMVSSLAEGADRIAAEEALSLGWELQCPLPFSATEYETDFPSVESKESFQQLLGRATAVMELDGLRAAQNVAYLAAGRMVLNQSDVLLAIWNGEAPRGEGGTGQIVEEARRVEIPVIWIALIRCGC
jgi:hypothetical protein